jgi:hypothetical protein
MLSIPLPGSTKTAVARQKCRTIRRSPGLVPALVGAFCLSLGGIALADGAFELDGALGLGLDSNPAQSHSGSALAFARYAVEALRSWSSDDDTLSLGGGGWYRDYEGPNDAYRLNLLTEWSRETGSGRGLWRFSLAGVAYRDALVPADARNEAAFGLRYDQLLSARHTLGLSVETRRLAYRQASLPWAGRPGAGASSSADRDGGSQGTDRGRGAVAVRRDDQRLRLGLDFTRHWSPGVSTRLALFYVDNDSPVHIEGYQRPGVDMRWRLEPNDIWRLEAGVGWSLTRYDAAPRRQEREDRQLSLGLAVHRSLGDLGWREAEFQCALDWLDSESTLEAYAFRQWVTQCGWFWSFR